MYFINLFYLCYSLHILEAINESNALTKTKRKKIPCVAVAGRLPGRSHSIQGKCNDCSLPTDLIDPESSKLLLHHCEYRQEPCSCDHLGGVASATFGACSARCFHEETVGNTYIKLF